MSRSAPRIAISVTLIIAVLGIAVGWILQSRWLEQSPSTPGSSGAGDSTPVADSAGRGDEAARGADDATGPSPAEAQGSASRSARIRLAGRVVTASGEGVEGAQVEFFPRGEGGESPPPWSARSGPDGRFTLAGFPEDDAATGRLTVSASGFLTATRLDVHPPTVEGATHDLGTIELFRGGMVRGQVTAPDGGPAAKVEVYTIRPGPKGGIEHARQHPRALCTSPIVETGEDGSFEIPGVRPGAVVVVADSPDHPLGHAADVRLAESGSIDGVRIQLVKPLALTGTVTDPLGEPIAGARVIAARSQEPGFRSGEFDILSRVEFSSAWTRCRAETGSDGSFRLENLEDDLYSVAVTVPGYSPASRNEVRPNRAPLRFVVRSNGRLVGRVFEEGSDEPIPEFQIAVRPAEAVDETFFFPAPARSHSFRDGEGAFVLDDLEPGSYELTVRALGFAPRRAGPFHVTRDPRGSQVTLRLDRGGRIEGRIVTAANDAPVESARVTLLSRAGLDPLGAVSGNLDLALLRDEGFVGSTRTDADGRFALEALPPGTYRLRVRRSGFAEITVEDLAVTARQTLVLDRIQLGRGGGLFGTVLEASGAARGGVRVTLRRSDGFSSITTSDAEGTYRFVHLEEGTYFVAPTEPTPMVIQRRRGDRPGDPMPFELPGERVEIVSGETRRLDLELPALGSIAGEVVGSFDESTGAEVRLYRVGNVVLSSAVPLGTDGAFSFEDLGPAVYRVTVAIGGHNAAGTTLELEEGAEERVTLTLPRGSLSGTVKARSGAPIPGALVRVQRVLTREELEAAGEERERFGRAADLFLSLDLLAGEIETDASGRYRATHLAEGTYAVEAGHPSHARQVLTGIELAKEEDRADVDLTLGPGGGVEGRIVQVGTRIGVPFANLTLIRESDGAWKTVMSDQMGRFNVSELTPGGYRVQGEKEGYSLAEVRVRVVAGESIPVTVDAYPTE